MAAAHVRQALQIHGTTSRTAWLCRDKPSMKDAIREAGIACAASARVEKREDARAFAKQHGYPVILKPVDGAGASGATRCDDDAGLEKAMTELRVDQGRAVAIEEFLSGHEGFYDTITVHGQVVADFATHYFPNVLEAMRTRWISPQIVTTNRIDQPSYKELRAMGQKAITALGVWTSATHMEWFFGPKGLKFSEIGARPAGEKIWDMYRFANEFDVYREWALATLGMASQQQPSRRFATGSVQVRPDRDGRVVRHEGLEQAWAECGRFVYEYEVPKPGTPTKPLDKGWLCNTWFRLRHEDYDTLRGLMTRIGATVRAYAT